MKAKFSPTFDELVSLYQRYSTIEIGAKFDVSPEVVRRKLHEFGIVVRSSGGRRSFMPDRKELQNLYQAMSAKEIAKQYGVGETVVWKRLKEYGIVLDGFEQGGHRSKTGKVFSETHIKNLSTALRKIGRGGARNPRYKDGVTQENLRLRRTGLYLEWKREALNLRGNKCESCGREKGVVCPCCGNKVTLHVHHVRSFAKYPEERFDPRNSEVLCSKCHYSRHSSKLGEFGGTPNA